MSVTADADLIREQTAVKLLAVCFRAKRDVPKTRLFEADPPTAWDVDHAFLNELLDDWQAHG